MWLSTPVQGLVDRLEVQGPLFGAAARRSVDRATFTELRALRRAAADLEQAQRRDDPTDRVHAVFTMFDGLRDASHNPALVTMLHVEREQTRRVLGSRAAQRELEPFQRHYLRQYVGTELVEALLDRDGAAAQEIVERVLGNVRAAVLDQASDRYRRN